MIYIVLTYLFYPVLIVISFLNGKRELRKILVIQTAKIGDMICTTPVFRAIKMKYPDTVLTIMADPSTAGLLSDNPHVDEIVTVKAAQMQGVSGKIYLTGLIRKEGYDAVICCNPNVPFAVAALWAAVPVRISIMPDYAGITFKIAAPFFSFITAHIKGRQVSETFLSMLKAIGIENSDITRDVYKSEGSDDLAASLLGGADRLLVGIAVSSGNRMKELGTEKISGLINLLTGNKNVYVVLVGSQHESDLAKKILHTIDAKQYVIDSTGKFKLNEIAALIEKLACFIGVDTGMTYMADALSVPVINIAGPSDMSDQRPIGNKSLIIQKDYSCVPCSHAFKSPYECRRGDTVCISSVSAEEIYEKAAGLLQEKLKYAN